MDNQEKEAIMVTIFNKGEREIVSKDGLVVKPKDQLKIDLDEANRLVKLFDDEVFIIGEIPQRIGDDVISTSKPKRGRKPKAEKQSSAPEAPEAPESTESPESDDFESEEAI